MCRCQTVQTLKPLINGELEGNRGDIQFDFFMKIQSVASEMFSTIRFGRVTLKKPEEQHHDMQQHSPKFSHNGTKQHPK